MTEPHPHTEGRFGRERERRRQEFLGAAWTVVMDEGIDGLTMQRVSNLVGSAEGTIYNYFSSKELLLAEIQEAALGVLATSVFGAIQALELRMPDSVDERARRLAPILLGARLWVESEALHPREVELSRRTFTHTSTVFTEEAGKSVAASAQALLDYACELFDQAAAAGALEPGDGFERAVTLLAGTTGILMAGGLARWDDRLDEARAFAHRNVADLLRAWGADPAVLDAAEGLLAATNDP